MFTKNEIVEYDSYAEVILYDHKNKEVARTLIDTEDISKAKAYKWYLSKSGYATYGNSSNSILLHRLVMDSPQGFQVDHKNHNKLDNRKNNLRICTNQQNSFNRWLQKNNTSGYPGVHWSKGKNKWITCIMVNQKKIQIGSYVTKEEAIIARKKTEEKYFGEFRFQEVSND